MEADTVELAIARHLVACGVEERDARATAWAFTEASRRGRVHHGVERVVEITRGLERGALRGVPQRRVVNSAPATAIIDGDEGLGPPAATDAVQRATEIARTQGLGFVGVVDAGHVGMLGLYTEIGAQSGMVTLMTSTTSPATVVPGGDRAVLGSNPLAFSVPTSGAPITADFSTSAVSRSTLLHHRETGEPLEPGWAVDSSGEGTTDPARAESLLPIGGGIKGTLIQLMLAVLAGPLIGAPANHLVSGTRRMTEPIRKGDVVVCIDPGSLGDVAGFHDGVRALIDEMCASSPAFRSPGQPRVAREIPLSDELGTLLDLA